MIQVVNRALSILELIASSRRVTFTLSEIADTLQLNHATCANILKTLVNRNYVEQIGLKKGYKLGYMAFQLTDPHAYHTELKKLAKPFIDRLRDKINETVILSIIEGGRRIILTHAECNQEIQVRAMTNSSVYRATTGRKLLGQYPMKELDFFIRKYGLPSVEDWPEIKNREDLCIALQEIKNNDVLVTSNTQHVVSLATLIYKNNNAIASLGIYLPDIRFNKEREMILREEILKTTDEINNAISEVTIPIPKSNEGIELQ